MNIHNLAHLYATVDKLPAELLAMETREGMHSLESIARQLIAEEQTVESDPTPPSIAAWLHATYEEVMNLFQLMPVAQPQCSKAQLVTASLAKQRIFDSYPAETRKRVMLSVLECAAVKDKVDWPWAKAQHDMEVAI